LTQVEGLRILRHTMKLSIPRVLLPGLITLVGPGLPGASAA
jgi:hypothetical protein